jgi:RNA polymerase sigma factor (sigma-70 family)
MSAKAVIPWQGGNSRQEFLASSPDELIPTRESLLSRLKDWTDEASWKEFFDTYWRLIYGVARQAGLTEAEAQDAVQDTIISVAKAMPRFHYDPAIGSFKSWLRQLTRWRIDDQLRKKQYQEDGRRHPKERPLGTATQERLADSSGASLERVWEVEWLKTVTQAALARIRGQTDPHQYQMFYLHLVKEIPAHEVAHRLGVKTMAVYFATRKISKMMQKEVRRLETQML